MATYVLIPGGGCSPWYWRPLAAELRERGHDVVAVDLPCDDDSAGLTEYADTAVDAIGDRTDLVMVAHSLGGFTAPLVCDRVPVGLLVMLQGMIPSPGEAPGDWWANTGYEQARREQAREDGTAPGDVADDFFHDVPPDLVAGAKQSAREQSATPFAEPWPLKAWPDVATRFLLCSDDRFIPAGLMRRVVRERLGIIPDEIATGHMPMLARPKELAERLEAYRTGR
ncbi:alpha/beta hydrolase [Actinomadura sp. HBU206391]|uniref:alpha/beta hydrolase n=1 Tax=Actinomadura sp. HBU206391 TaxID=2731692 RepID=UPI00164F2DE6|nr:alpha/beta hydrolase [Actinomadura sp. HBU206391]MBC6459488.1 alpha/beta hydrolase [Actinomadura sp. HBU206391]